MPKAILFFFFSFFSNLPRQCVCACVIRYLVNGGSPFYLSLSKRVFGKLEKKQEKKKIIFLINVCFCVEHKIIYYEGHAYKFQVAKSMWNSPTTKYM